jgi:hypothetical protein
MEMSNKTLAMLLVAAIAVSLFGTIFSLNKLGGIGTTGYAVNVNGTATVYVNASTSIRYAVNSVNWGTGSVNSTAFYNCTMSTDAANSGGCLGFTSANGAPFILENDGNNVALINLAANATALTFLGVSPSGLYGNTQFKWKVTANETGACLGTLSPAAGAYANVNTTGPGTRICDTPGLNTTESSDSLKIDIYVNIPYDVPGGSKSATLTATAS